MKLMMKIIGWSAAGSAGLLIACIIIIQSISNAQYKEWISDLAFSATGRQLVFDGDVDIHFGKEIRFLAKEIRFANTAQGSRPDMVTADRLLLQVALLPIFKGVLDFVIELDGPDILLETDSDGRRNWVFQDSVLKEPDPEQDPKKTAGSFSLPLKPYIRNCEINNLKFTFTDDEGDKQILADIETFKIFVDGDEIPLTVKAAYNGAPVELVGVLGRIDELHSNRQTEISLNGKVNSADFTLNGLIGPLSPRPNAQVDLLLKADSISTFSQYAGITLPDLKGLDISLRAQSKGGYFAAEDIKILLNDEILDLSITGNIEDISHVEGINLITEVNSEHLDKVLEEIGVKLSVALPAFTSVGGTVTGNLEELSLNSLIANVKDEGITVNLNGQVTDLLSLEGVDVNFDATADSIANISKFAGTEIPELGSLQLAGKISSSEQSLRLESLEAIVQQQGMKTRVTAAVADLINVAGINAEAHIEIDSLSTLAPFTDVEMPQTKPWVLNITVAAAETKGAAEVVVNLTSEELQAVINANIPEIKDPANLEASLSIDTESLAVISEMLGKEIVDEGPVKLTAKAIVQPDRYRVDDFKLTRGESVANAGIQYVLPKSDQDKPKLIGQLEINNLDLTKIFPANDNENLDQEETQVVIAETESETTSTVNKKIFSNEPLSTGVLQDYEVDFKVDTSNLTLSENFMVHGSLAVTLDQGVLKIGPLDLKGESGGSGESLIVLDASSPEANLGVKIKFDNFVSPRFGGNFDLDVDLDGKGGTIAAVMGSLDGQFIAAFNDYKLNQSAMTQFGSGFFSRINPIKNDTTILECAIVRFDAKDGIVDFTKKIAAQTTEVTWFGSGEINLKTEELDFGIHPQPRKALNSLTDLGLAKLVHIGGTLAEPSIGVDPKDVAVKYGKYSAYIATGGLSWLAEKVLENRESNVDQCKRILDVFEE